MNEQVHVRCVRCSREHHAPLTPSAYGGWVSARVEASDIGWRAYRARSVRWYCPDHSPKSPRMVQVFPDSGALHISGPADESGVFNCDPCHESGGIFTNEEG